VVKHLISLLQALNLQISLNQAAFIEKGGFGTVGSEMARGAGFEPARPKRTTGLAGLPPTRLGQPRKVTLNPVLFFLVLFILMARVIFVFSCFYVRFGFAKSFYF
jgi:hypothetical protein